MEPNHCVPPDLEVPPVADHPYDLFRGRCRKCGRVVEYTRQALRGHRHVYVCPTPQCEQERVYLTLAVRYDEVRGDWVLSPYRLVSY